MKKLLALLLAAVMVFALAACNGTTDPTDPSTPADTTPSTPAESTDPVDTTPTIVAEPSATQLLNGKTYGEKGDFITLYDKFGADVTVADTYEDELTGLAYAEFEGETYELGMDFLSMAMVYNAANDQEYATWWKYYITRWNYLMPEVPLYSNEYYDFYNAQIKGVTEFPTNPYWSPSDALIDWTSEKEDKSIILGNTTDLSGKFRYATFGGTSPGAADLDVSDMTSGLETVSTTKEGGYVYNSTVVKEHTEVDNADGTRTYTITLYEDMLFSDGTPVKAVNYLYFPVVFSTPVAAQAAAKDHQALQSAVGFADFNAYDGTNEGVEIVNDKGEATGVVPAKAITGLRLLGDYQFSITIADDYIPYFYAIAYAGFSPTVKELWMGEFDLADDGNGVYITGDFYAKNAEGNYAHAAHISESAVNTDTTYAYSGPYVVESYDAATKEATLKINPNFKGNYEGVKPSIEKVVYKKIVSETQLEDFKAGGIDVLNGVTGGEATNEAIALADASNGAYVYTHYSRAGYGKLGFRADYGAAQYIEVRQAVALCMDRATFAKDFTGGYGGVVDGPYYTGSWMYKEAVNQGMLLNTYDTSVDAAIAVLEEAGWVYNAEGGAYTEGVRYKRISGEYATENDKNYQSVDGAHKTVEIDGDYYMPLVLNWYGTSANEFTDLLVTGFEQNDNIIAAGFYIQKTIGEFAPMLDELYQAQIYGYYSGTPMYTCFNFATGFTSAAYDYSWNWSIDPFYFENYSVNYVKDVADIYWLG